MRFDTTPNLHYGDMDYVRNWDRMITEFREQIAMHRERFGCRHLALFSNTPGLTHRQLMDNLALFGERVIPQFRD